MTDRPGFLERARIRLEQSSARRPEGGEVAKVRNIKGKWVRNMMDRHGMSEQEAESDFRRRARDYEDRENLR